MKKISFLLCFIVSLLFSSFSFSQPVSRSWPVSKVYRADSRSPDDVFKNGFFAWGTNINFNAHVLGLSGSRGSRDSAFIPTTSAPSIAERFAIDLRNVSPQGVSYVYNIRATNNFYSALDTMYYIYSLFPGAHSFVPSEVRALLAREQEYSAYQNIPAQLVESVTIYRAGQPTVTERNPNYIPDHTYSNANPFTYYHPDRISVSPYLLMGQSLTNVNNELPGLSAHLPSPSFTASSILSTQLLF